jgi:glycosyltransferase involved in cell wall biosynthesis
VGRLTIEKGAHVLIDALHEMADPPECELIGEGAGRPALEARVQTLGLNDRVRFRGLLPRSESQAAIRRARLLVIPSVCNEGFPMVFREAMAMGVPVLASRIGSLGEIVREGWNGRLFEPGQPEALATALEQMLANSEVLRQMGENAFQEFSLKYSETVAHETLMRIYEAAQRRLRTRAARPDGGGSKAG